MSIIVMSPNLLAGSYVIGQKRYDMTEQSEAPGGATSARLLGPPRWTLAMTSPDNAGLTQAQAALWQSMILRLRGRVNHLAAWDLGQPAPRGSMRGNLTLNASVSAGAVSATIIGAGQANSTLLAGDWLQIGTQGLGSQLVKVLDDATANGSGIITVNFEPPLRAGYSAGALVTWDKPLAYFKQTTPAPAWGWKPGSPGILIGFALDMLEAWS